MADLTMDDMKDYLDMKLTKFGALLAAADVATEKREKPKLKTTVRNSDDGGAGPSSSRSKKRKGKSISINPPPPLPPQFKNAIQELGRGKTLTPPRFVIQKFLFETDVKIGNNRLSIPLSQIADDFLTEEEKEYLRGRSESNGVNFMEVKMVEPSLAAVDVMFRRWDMDKRKGSGCITYNINGKWKDVVESNNLEAGMEVQLWSFRVDQHLCFALVLLPES